MKTGTRGPSLASPITGRQSSRRQACPSHPGVRPVGGREQSSCDPCPRRRRASSRPRASPTQGLQRVRRRGRRSPPGAYRERQSRSGLQALSSTSSAGRARASEDDRSRTPGSRRSSSTSLEDGLETARSPASTTSCPTSTCTSSCSAGFNRLLDPRTEESAIRGRPRAAPQVHRPGRRLRAHRRPRDSPAPRSGSTWTDSSGRFAVEVESRPEQCAAPDRPGLTRPLRAIRRSPAGRPTSS